MTQGSGKLPPIFMIGLVIVAGMAIIGWGSPKQGGTDNGIPELTLIQSGTNSVALSSATVGFTTITFNPAYSVTPNFKILQTSVATPPVNTYQTSSLSFFSLTSLGQTWTNMPAATTEIFNDQDHELWADLTLASSAIFEVNCATASNTAGAYLDVPYSTDGTTWNSLTGTVAFQVLIDGSNILGNCQIGPFPAVSNNGTPAALVAGAKAKVFLRIIGSGGGGLGDNPNFSEAHLLVFSSIGVSCNYGTAPLGLTSTIAKVQVVCSAPVTFTYNFQWIAGIPA